MVVNPDLSLYKESQKYTMKIEKEEIIIRETAAGDLENVLNVLKRSFGYDKEAKLVKELWNDPTAEPVVSLIALHRNEPAGYILFTRACFEEANEQPLMHILAPMGVIPELQQNGIGGMLIEAGIEKLKELGSRIVYVLGHKEYYPKYGFRPHAAKWGYEAPYPVPEAYSDYWMIQYITPDQALVPKGKIRCADTLNRPEHWRDEEADR